jgi:hypothetical protein
MHKALTIQLIILLILITACGGQKPEIVPLAVITSEVVTQPAKPVFPTNTPLSSPAIIALDTSTPTTRASIETPSTSVSYTNNVVPILENNCYKCHGVEQIKEGLDMRTYETLMAGSFNGVVIVPGNADDSFLVQQVLDGKMPKRGPKLTLEQIQIIINWINQGALNN